MKQLLLLPLALCCFWICPATAQVPEVLRGEITNPYVARYEYGDFGAAIAADGNQMIVGAPRANVLEGSGEQGSVTLYEFYDVAVMGRPRTYPNPNLNSAQGGRFGHAVAFDGNYFTVGAPYNAINGTSLAGNAYCYDKNVSHTRPYATLVNPNPLGFEQFGSAVAMNGASGYAAVSALGIETAAAATGMVHIYRFRSTGAPLQFSIPNPAPARGGFFGQVLAIDGTQMAVGNPGDGGRKGKVYIYSTSAPTLLRELTSPATATENEYFGASLSFSGNFLAVGAPEAANYQGRVYIYNLAGATPTVPIRILENPAPGIVGEGFGTSVALRYPNLLVGNPGDIRNGAQQYGCVHRYNLSSATPATSLQTYVSNAPQHGEALGQAVAWSGNGSVAIVGVPKNSHDAATAGAVASWAFGSSTLRWIYPRKTVYDGFGNDVDIDGNLMAVGAPAANRGELQAGRVDVFDRTSSTPNVPVLTLSSPEPGEEDQFGFQVALSGRLLVVSAPYFDDGSTARVGKAYVYDLEGPQPQVPIHTLVNPNPAPGSIYDMFGYRLDLEGSLLVLWNNVEYTLSGEVIVYDLSSATPTTPVRRLTSPTPRGLFGISLALSGSRLAVGESTSYYRRSFPGQVFVYELAGTSPQTPIFIIPSPVQADDADFGDSIALDGDRLVSTVMQADSSGLLVRKVMAYDLASATPLVPAFTLGTLDGDSTVSFGSTLAIEEDTIIAQSNNTLRRYDWSSIPAGAVQQTYTGDRGNAAAISDGWVIAGYPYTRTDADAGGIVRLYGPNYAEIAVAGNGVNIASGDTTPDASDHTDFGRAALGGSGLVRTFTLRSLGSSELTLAAVSGGDRVAILGPDSAHFSVTTQPASPVAASTGNTTFSIRFSPLSEGLKTAEVRLAPNDDDESPFTFAISGEGRLTSPAGESWEAQPASGTRVWTHLAVSADGVRLAATTNGGQIHLSTDSGLTWTARETNRLWSGIACSADGTRLAVTVEGGQIYVSSDSGATWTAVENARNWTGITCSADGMNLAAVDHGGFIHTSADHGMTWAPREEPRAWRTIASSSDGTRLAAAVEGGQIHTSTDSGVTWTARETARAWKRIACSADGRVLAALASSAEIFVSTDSGVTWTARDSARAWTGITVSGDGTHMAAAEGGVTGRIYVSVDSGNTWTPKAVDNDWSVLAGSADGSLLAAGVRQDAIWTSTGVVDPVISIWGNDELIANGDATPAEVDHTDFGNAATSGGVITRTYTVRNPGSLNLNLTGAPAVVIGGPNPGDFSVESQPVTPISPFGGSAIFAIRFDPTALGVRTAVVTIASDDSDQNPYSFTITGTGIRASYTLTPESEGDGSISPAAPLTILEGGTFTFTGTPGPGYMLDRWRVNGVDAQTGGLTFTTPPVQESATVTALFVPNPEAPAFTVQPQNVLALLGGPASFAPTISGGRPMTFQWRKGTLNIANATEESLMLPASVSSDLGSYIVVTDNAESLPVTSQAGYLGLVTPAAATQSVRRGTTLTLRCIATAPTAAGVSLSYEWQFEGAPLMNGTQANGTVVANADKAVMTLTKADFVHSGTYTCVVTMNTPGNDPSLTCGDIEVGVLGDPPVMDTIPMPASVSVGQNLDMLLTASGSPTSFTVAGLPTGLKLDPLTGRISGRPNAASKKDNAGNYIPNKLTLRATNVWGTGPAVDFFMIIEALAPSLVGTFNGIVARSAHSNFGLGGHVQITVAATGVITGSATLAGQKHTIRGALEVSPGSDPYADVTVFRSPTTLGTLDMRISFTAGTDRIEGVIIDPLTKMTQGRFEAGEPASPGLVDGDYTGVRFRSPSAIVLSAEGSGFIADTGNHTIRIIDPLLGIVTTLAGSTTAGSADGTGSTASFNAPEGLALDAAGNLFVADTGNSTIRKVTPDGTVTTFAGAAGQPGSTNGSAAAARFTSPCGVCFDPAGNLYVVDRGNHTVRKITPAGVVTTLAGLANAPGHKDGQIATSRLNTPTSIVYDPVIKNLFLTDTGNQVVRRIMLNGLVSTYAGSPGVSGMDDGITANARFNSPRGIATLGDGTLIVADKVLRQISRSGVVGTISEELSPDDHPVALAWHGPSASILALHDTLHSLSIHTATVPLNDAFFTARRNPWTTTTTVPTAEQGRYNAALQTPVVPSETRFPQGDGYASVTITTNGTATWAGKTADGVSFTFSTFMAADHIVPLHAMMYLNTGSLQGECAINPATLDIVNHPTSALDWLKIAQPLNRADRSYKAGFPTHALDLFGGKYVPGNIHSYLGLTSTPAAMQLDFADSRVPSFQQPFTITAPNTVKVPANNRTFTLQVNATTGVFSGTFRDGTPSVTSIFAGILIDYEAGGAKRGHGHSLLPDNTTTTAPIQSGRVWLEAE